MALRILFADAVYPQVKAAVLKSNPEIEMAPWRTRSHWYLAAMFHCADAWPLAMRSLGCESAEVVLDRPGALAEATEEEWDAVVLRHPHLSDMDLGAFASARLSVCMVTSDAAAWKWSRGRGLHVTSFPQYVQPEVTGWRYLPLAFDGRRAERAQPWEPWATRSIPVAFVGSLGRGQWPQAVHALSKVAETIPEFRWWGQKVGDVGEHLDRTYCGEAWGLDYWSVLGDTRLLLNRHGAINLVGGRWEAANMRLFEATGMGCLLFTEAAWNLPDMFTPWSECIPYDNPDDLARLVKHYLRWQDRAEEIARAGRDRTLLEHRYEDRAAKLLGWIEEALR